MRDEDSRHLDREREGSPERAEVPRTITERVLALMQVIADFVRGRETHEHRNELGR